MDWKDTGETTAPISFLQKDQISLPSVFLILKSLQTLVCLKLVPSGNTLVFGPISFAPPTLSLTLLLKATEFLSLICLRSLLFLTDLRLSGLIFFSDAISELIECR